MDVKHWMAVMSKVLEKEEKEATFIVVVLCDVKQTKDNSDVVKDVVQAAERVSGIGGVEPSILHNYVFSRGKKIIGNKWKMMIFRLLMFYMLQRNTRSLVANWQELKRFVDAFK